MSMSESGLPGTSRLELIAVPDLPDFVPGDALADLIVSGCIRAGLTLLPGDIVVIAQKIVSKCEGAYADLGDIEPGAEAANLASVTGKDARLCQVILNESSEVLRARPGLVIVANKAGHVMANAGIDQSNIDNRDGERLLLLPADSDASARDIRLSIKAQTGVAVAVVINDSWGRAWRNGTSGHAIGCAGLPSLWDRRGESDLTGRPLKVTQIGLADEIAAAASLVMGAASERQPVVIVRGYRLPEGDRPARDLVRDPASDLFR